MNGPIRHLIDRVLEVRELREDLAMAIARTRSAENARARAEEKLALCQATCERLAMDSALRSLKAEKVASTNIVLAQKLEWAELLVTQWAKRWRQDHAE